jgi:transposase
MLLTEGPTSDYKGAALVLDALPKAQELIADRGYDADWFRHALAARGTTACIPPNPTARSPSRTMSRSIDIAIRSRSCSGASKTGPHPHPL